MRPPWPENSEHLRQYCKTPGRDALLPGYEWIQYTDAMLACLPLRCGCALWSAVAAPAVTRLNTAVAVRFCSDCRYRQSCMFRIKQRKHKGTGKLHLNAWQYERSVALERFGEDYLAGWLAEYGVRRPKNEKISPDS